MIQLLVRAGVLENPMGQAERWGPIVVTVVVLLLLGGFSCSIKSDEPRWSIAPGPPPILLDQKTGDSWQLGTSPDGHPAWQLLRR